MATSKGGFDSRCPVSCRLLMTTGSIAACCPYMSVHEDPDRSVCIESVILTPHSSGSFPRGNSAPDTLMEILRGCSSSTQTLAQPVSPPCKRARELPRSIVRAHELDLDASLSMTARDHESSKKDGLRGYPHSTASLTEPARSQGMDWI
eukprot:41945-Hanusia_phi.AAC.2